MIKIDKEKCNGCGACAAACHEGAIAMTGGKARLVREDYCDGLGDCLPACPTGAISFEVREAPAYNRAAVLAAKKKAEPDALPCGCPGTQGRAIRREQGDCCNCAGGREAESRLLQWPVQIRLVAGNAPYFDGANLLVAADCTAYAFGNFHEKFIQGRVTLIGCPKLDDVDYAEKLTAIFGGAHGGALLRRDGKGCDKCPAGKRQADSCAGCDHIRQWENPVVTKGV